MRTAFLFFILSILLTLFTTCNKDEDQGPGDNGSNKGTVTDIDGNVYETVKIGDQDWMAEDLRVTSYNDGTPIDSNTFGLYDPAIRLANPHLTRGYQYSNLKTATNVCPIGWHLPSREEWNELKGFVAHDSLGIFGGQEGKALKSEDGWLHDGNGTDVYGFKALPGGVYLVENDSLIHVGLAGYWLSSSRFGDGNFWFRYMWHHSNIFSESTNSGHNRISIRCIKD